MMAAAAKRVIVMVASIWGLSRPTQTAQRWRNIRYRVRFMFADSGSPRVVFALRGAFPHNREFPSRIG
jgi:hypothetical protein